MEQPGTVETEKEYQVSKKSEKTCTPENQVRWETLGYLQWSRYRFVGQSPTPQEMGRPCAAVDVPCGWEISRCSHAVPEWATGKPGGESKRPVWDVRGVMQPSTTHTWYKTSDTSRVLLRQLPDGILKNFGLCLEHTEGCTVTAKVRRETISCCSSSSS